MSEYICQEVRRATEDEAAWFTAFGGASPMDGEAWYIIDGKGHLLPLSSVHSTEEKQP